MQSVAVARLWKVLVVIWIVGATIVLAKLSWVVGSQAANRGQPIFRAGLVLIIVFLAVYALFTPFVIANTFIEDLRLVRAWCVVVGLSVCLLFVAVGYFLTRSAATNFYPFH